MACRALRKRSLSDVDLIALQALSHAPQLGGVMELIKRLRLAVPLVLIALLLFPVISSAQPGPGNGLLPAGNYHITTLSAGYFACCGEDPSHPFLSVDVTHTTTLANPLVGSSTTTDETDVFIQANGGPNSIFGGGCFIARSSDFVSGGLSSAVLNTAFDPTTSQSCENSPVSLPAFSLNVAWSGMSPVGTTRKTTTYSCTGYNAEVEILDTNDNASASATLSLFDSSITAESGGLGSNDQRWETHGIAQDACSSFGIGGGGKGAGPGPTSNGEFEFISQSAGANVPGGFVGLTTFSKVSRPTGTPPSTTKETELTVVSFGFQFFFLCFALQPPNTFAFGSGLSSASVHAVIDANTPACTGFTNGPFDPFTVDLMWTATGPLASIHNSAISGCGAFHQVLLSSDSNNPATASGTVSLFPGDFASSQASINSSDRRFEDTGAAPQGCILRP
jgi:hypothetical protein